MINAASSRLQTNQVIESKNTSFTVTHLVLKIIEVPSKTENGEKNDWTFTMSTFIPTHQRAKVRAAILFSLFKPSGFFTLQINLSWRHSRSSLAWPLFFQLRPLQAWLASGAHSKAVGSTSASEGTGRFQSVKIDRTGSLLKLRSTISLCSTIYWQFHLWLGKGKCEESSVLGEHEKGRSGC